MALPSGEVLPLSYIRILGFQLGFFLGRKKKKSPAKLKEGLKTTSLVMNT